MYVIHSMERRHCTLVPYPRQPRDSRFTIGLRGRHCTLVPYPRQHLGHCRVGLDVARIRSTLSKTVLQMAVLLLQSQFTALAVAMRYDRRESGTLSDMGVSGWQLVVRQEMPLSVVDSKSYRSSAPRWALRLYDTTLSAKRS